MLQPTSETSPLISIVVPSFNQGVFLEQNLKSILRQSFKNYEIILLDGGSTDISRLVINKYKSRCSFVRQEKDGGHYAAINEGFSIAKGDLLMWLNSDDMLHPGALDLAARAYTAFLGEADLFTGYPCTWDELGRLTSINLSPPSWSQEYFLEMNPRLDSYMQQESTFFTRKLWENIGGLQCDKYPYAADFDLWLRMCLHSPVIRLPYLIGGFRIHAQQRSHQIERYCFEVESSRDEFRRNLAASKEASLGESEGRKLSGLDSATTDFTSVEVKRQHEASALDRCRQLQPSAGILYTSISPRNTRQQQDSIANWLCNGFQVFSVNSSQESAIIREDYPSIEFAEPAYTLESQYGKPYVPIAEMVGCCARASGYSGIINSDIRFLSAVSAESVIANVLRSDQAENTLFIGSRIELTDVCRQLDAGSAVKGLSPLSNGHVYTYGFDIFIAKQSVWEKLQVGLDNRHNLALGIPWWDYYLPYRALEAGIKLTTIYPPVIAHLYHPAQYSPKVWNAVGQSIAGDILGLDSNGSRLVKLDEFSREMIKFIHGSANECDFGQSLRGPSAALSSLRERSDGPIDRLHWMIQTPETYHRNHYGLEMASLH